MKEEVWDRSYVVLAGDLGRTLAELGFTGEVRHVDVDLALEELQI